MALNKKIAIVTWEDIVHSDSEWRSEDEALDWSATESGIVSQVGYVLDQDENYITLTDSFFQEGEMVGSVIRIPMAVVKEVRIL